MKSVFLKVGKTWYKVSEEMLAWPQAQYSCMNMQGELRNLKFLTEEAGKITDTSNDINTLCLGFCEIYGEVLA